MIVDTSALLAIVFREKAAMRLAHRVAAAPNVGIGAPTLTETGIVLGARLGAASRPLLARLVEELELRIVPFDARHTRVARDAYLEYGKGRHPAALNFGDCMGYAIAKVANQPLLFIGRDFARTDIQPAL